MLTGVRINGLIIHVCKISQGIREKGVTAACLNGDALARQATEDLAVTGKTDGMRHCLEMERVKGQTHGPAPG